MERRDAFQLYVDYLLAGTTKATATGLSAALDEQIKHDYISDCLNQDVLGNKALWKEIKSLVRRVESQEGYLSIDDVIVEKPHSTVNEIINYHFDHTKGKSVKGINILNFLLTSPFKGQDINLPLAFHIIHKTEKVEDKDGKVKMKSKQTKNEIMRDQLHRVVFLNKVLFKYVLFDIWFSASENLKYIHQKLKKSFICPLKTNRLIALSLEDKMAGKFIRISDVKIENSQVIQVYVKGLDFPVSLVKQVFINKDHSTAELFLITNDTNIDHQKITTIYQKRWKVEECHKSLKQNTLLGKSPTKMETTQSNHIFASMLAFIKLERLKIKERLNHFALKAKLYLRSIQAAMTELHAMQKT
ncbi:IS701 family transposase, partial [Algivirga pacifica]|uniref:IS701 family transposase n=1 Tax=Algivirga pacifica TaxID=1162670 RepID=UPI0031E7F2DB